MSALQTLAHYHAALRRLVTPLLQVSVASLRACVRACVFACVRVREHAFVHASAHALAWQLVIIA